MIGRMETARRKGRIHEFEKTGQQPGDRRGRGPSKYSLLLVREEEKGANQSR